MPTLFSRSPAPPRKDKASTLPSRGISSGPGTPVEAATSPLKPTTRTSTFSVQSRTGVAGGFQAFDAGQGGRGSGLSEFGAMPGVGAVSRTLPSQNAGPLTPPDSPTAPPLLPPKYSFLPTRVSSIAHSISSDSFHYGAEDVVGYRPYGFLGGVGAKVVLGVEDVGKVIKDVGKELGKRGVTTPMLFSNQALDLNPTRTRALIQSYVESISSTSSRKADTWVQDLQFAREYELAWLFRWAVSRITRIREGSRELCHGFMEWEAYEEWRGRERASDYPLDAFPYFSAIVPPPIFHQILTPLFALLSKFAAYSHISGLTPHTLSSLFAPLLFDIPASSSCMAAHTTFIRAASATEHMLLAYIRSSSNKGGLGLTDLPSRLKDWVAGYPAMVASDGDLARASPRRGARVLRCERASRTVRSYSKDLIVNAESWAADIGQQWEAWDRVVLRGRRGETGRPKFSGAWRRKMAVKETLPLPSSSSSSAELSRKMSYGRAQKPGQSPPQNRRNTRVEGEEEARWGSLAGKEWSMFEEGGFDFDSPSKSKEELRSKLQFDLTESAKLGISQRRQTMDWTEFASSTGGFNRTDPLLDMSLTFSAPLADSITGWPRERDDLAKRLHKAQKDAVPFNYDTTPRVGAAVSQDSGSRADGKGRVYIEEAFVDCWSDWMMGGGWADREELTFKEANWVLIEYKARPSRGDDVPDSDPLADPRTSDLYFLFEESVPVDYQMAVADPKQKKTFGLFSSKKKRGPSSTLPRSPRAAQFDNTDFDRMLVHRDRTKKLTLSSKDAPGTAIWHVSPDINSTLKSTLPRSPVGPGQPLSPLRREAPRRRTRSSGRDSVEEAKMHEGKASFFSSIKKDRALRGVKTDESMRDKFKKDKERQRAKEVDFEIHTASGLSSPDDAKDKKKVGKGAKEKDDDKWMDILIANGARRMDRQDAVGPVPKPKTGPAGGLPISPRPPRQYSPAPQALPADFDPYATHTRTSTDTDRAGYAGVQDQAALYATHSPETSGSVDAHEAVTPEEGADLARFPSWKRKPVPPIDESNESTESGPEPRDDAPVLGPVVPPKSERRGPDTPPKGPRTEILSPSPTRQKDRDTIHNIVDIYNRDSTSTDFEPSSDLGESPRRSTEYNYEDPELSSGSKGRTNGTSNGMADGTPGNGKRYDMDRLTPPDAREEDDELGEMKPPGMMFDLTPGREPSPARYKHGEPLSFVGEEEEGDL